MKKGKKAFKKFEFIVGFLGSINNEGNDDIMFEKGEKHQVKYVEKKPNE